MLVPAVSPKSNVNGSNSNSHSQDYSYELSKTLFPPHLIIKILPYKQIYQALADPS